MRNSLGREGLLRPYEGAFVNKRHVEYSDNKEKGRVPEFSENLDDVLDALELRDGITVSFHHHLRNGDQVLNLVMGKLQERGLKGVTVAASSFFPCHAPLVPMFEDGTVTRLHASYMSGPVARAVSEGKDIQSTAI